MSITVQVEPGYRYEITQPDADAVEVETRWVGGALVAKGAQALSSPLRDPGPLAPMYRRRLIVKLDDLQDFSLAAFQRVIAAIGENGGKADLGINPGKSQRPLYQWLRTLDLTRFEVWNHSWDHGAHQPLHRGLPLSVQLAHLDLVQQKVKGELGVVPRAFGDPGIRYRGGWIGDQDEVTYLAVRAHPELVAIYDGGRTARQLGLQDEPDPLFDPIVIAPFERPPGDWKRGEPGQRYPLEYVAAKYPEEDANRPPICGNAEEMIWRLDHPSTDLADVDRQGAAYAQFHPWFWAQEGDAAAFGTWVKHVVAQQVWRFTNCYEAYQWNRDKAHLGLEKTAPDRYRLDARLLRFSHDVELDLPADSRVERSAYVVPLPEVPEE